MQPSNKLVLQKVPLTLCSIPVLQRVSGTFCSIGMLLLSSCMIVGTEDDQTADLRKNAIRTAVVQHKKEVVGCYTYELKKNPLGTPSGKVQMEWEVDAEGHATKIAVNEELSTLKIPTLNRCLIDAFTEMTFPPPSKGMDLKVKYPLVFNNDGEK